ncbi:hypothetical protein llap_541 [Limosa lapponica baueri]|uniref:Uncharacterized protein n=1 Tax=Limosa lapponica baueri TaxID=1758121 RepID=A0A2I0UST5_LIMLA|nr:hypothetical protein llap_541 [Limosa lapponica baueri]
MGTAEAASEADTSTRWESGVTQSDEPTPGQVQEDLTGRCLWLLGAGLALLLESTVGQLRAEEERGWMGRINIIDKDVEENRPQYRALWDTTRDRSPTGLHSIHHHSPHNLHTTLG